MFTLIALYKPFSLSTGTFCEAGPYYDEDIILSVNDAFPRYTQLDWPRMKATLSCRAHYKTLSGSSIVACQQDGSWSVDDSTECIGMLYYYSI